MSEALATNLSPFPGDDAAEACSILLGELGAPHIPAMPVLAQRGVGAEPVGRSAAMLAELPVEMTSYGWRLCDRPGLDLRRAQGWLRGDVNALADVVGQQHLSVPVLRLTMVGPVSLAAALHLGHGERAISDAGAVRELAASQREGLTALLRSLREAVPAATVELQLDEPMVGSALAGTIGTISGYRTLRAVERSAVRTHWSEFVQHAAQLGAGRVDLSAELDLLGLIRETGISGIVLPAAGLTYPQLETLAEALDGGVAGTLQLAPIAAVPETARSLWTRLRDVGVGAAELSRLRVADDGSAAKVAGARQELTKLTQLAGALNELAAS